MPDFTCARFPRNASRSATCLIWLTCLVLCACGGSSPPPRVHVVRPGRPIWCPTISSITAPPARLSAPNQPGAGSFDTRALIGRPITQAAAEARRHGCLWRIVERDGHALIITADARANRIDAAEDHGIVTATGTY